MSPARAWSALAVLTLPALLVSIDNTVLGVALPALSTALRPDASTLLWVVDVYPLVLAGLLVTMGSLGDRIGRRRLLLIGVSGFGLVSLLAAYATSAGQLVAARALLGFFGAMLMPSTLALLRTVFTDRARRRVALAVWATGFAAGAALGPIVGGVLLEHFWWGSVFAVNAPVAVLLVVGALVLLPESRTPEPEPLDLPGAALTLLTMAPLVLAVKLVGSGGPVLAIVGAAAVGLTAGWAFVVRSRRLVRAGRRPLIDLGLFASPVLRHSALANATTMFGLTGLLFFAAQYLQLVLGASPLEAGVLLLPGFLATVLAGLASARLARRVPLHVLVPSGLAAVLAGYLVCLGLGAHTAVLVPVVAAVLIGTGIGLSETATNDAILAAVPPERAGAASAVSETAYEIGAVLGTALLGGALSAVYRGSVVLPDGTPAAAGETLGAAVDSAGVLEPGPASALLASARDAFSLGVDVAAGTGAAVVAAVLVVTAVGLRRAARTVARAGSSVRSSDRESRWPTTCRRHPLRRAAAAVAAPARPVRSAP